MHDAEKNKCCCTIQWSVESIDITIRPSCQLNMKPCPFPSAACYGLLWSWSTRDSFGYYILVKLVELEAAKKEIWVTLVLSITPTKARSRDRTSTSSCSETMFRTCRESSVTFSYAYHHNVYHHTAGISNDFVCYVARLYCTFTNYWLSETQNGQLKRLYRQESGPRLMPQCHISLRPKEGVHLYLWIQNFN